VLLRGAPHIIRPLRFVMPHDQGQRPAWMIRAGLFLYDHLARRELLPASAGADLRRHPAGESLKPEFTRGFVYSDCWVDDARLVVLNAIDAADKGATILTNTVCESAHRKGKRWIAALRSADGKRIDVHAHALVNATGPWAAQFLRAAVHQSGARAIRLVKGSHIVVRKLFDHPFAYIFQHPDGRIVFAIPYESEFTLIGTTDLEYHGDLNRVLIEPEEIGYLCELANRYFQKPITSADVIWSYSGVRPLVNDEAAAASEISRDYRLELDGDGAPMLSVFGGKITTFRRLAEDAVDLISAGLPVRKGHWTAHACLPGGDLFGTEPSNRAVTEFGQYVLGLQERYAWLDPRLVTRYARAYGTRIDILLAGRGDISELGEEIAPGLYGAEVCYWMRREWATCAADMLWRRSKMGLHLPADTEKKLDAWISRKRTHHGAGLADEC
jgi:glycerol-3-phosphate dehydrogenase